MGARRSALLVLLLTVFVDLVGFGIIIPLLPVYAKSYGATGMELGLVLSLFSLMQFLTAPFWGRLSDRIGRRPVLIVTLFISAAGYTILALARSFEVILLSRVVAGLGGANIAVAQAMIADIYPPKERAKGMGMIGAAFGLGFVFGPAIGGLAVNWGGPTGPGWAAAVICGVNAIATIFIIKETRKGDVQPAKGSLSPFAVFHGLRRVLQLPGVGRWILAAAVAMLAFSAFEVTYSLFVQSRLGFTESGIYWIFVYIGLLIVLVQGGLVRKFVPRFGERRLVIWGAFITGAGMLVLALAGNLATLLAASLLIAVGQGIRSPSVQSLISRGASAHEQGHILGTAQGMLAIARIVGPILGGWLYGMSTGPEFGIVRYALSFIAAAVLLALAGWIAVGGKDAVDAPEPATAPETG